MFRVFCITVLFSTLGSSLGWNIMFVILYYCVYNFVCCVLFWVCACVILCIVVPLPPGTYPLEVHDDDDDDDRVHRLKKSGRWNSPSCTATSGTHLHSGTCPIADCRPTPSSPFPRQRTWQTPPGRRRKYRQCRRQSCCTWNWRKPRPSRTHRLGAAVDHGTRSRRYSLHQGGYILGLLLLRRRLRGLAGWFLPHRSIHSQSGIRRSQRHCLKNTLLWLNAVIHHDHWTQSWKKLT